MKVEIILEERDGGKIGRSKGGKIVIRAPKNKKTGPTIFAHELGHLVDLLYNEEVNILSSLPIIHLNKKMIIPIEASAWRWALKILPNLDKKEMKEAFMTYVYD